jgi:hypothetical protein
MSCLKRKGRTPNEFLLYTYLIYYLLVKNLDIHEVGIFIIQALYIIQQDIYIYIYIYNTNTRRYLEAILLVHFY